MIKLYTKKAWNEGAAMEETGYKNREEMVYQEFKKKIFWTWN